MVKRYDKDVETHDGWVSHAPMAVMYETPDGEYVKHDDYEALQKELENHTRALKAMRFDLEEARSQRDTARNELKATHRQLRRLQTGEEIESDRLTEHELAQQAEIDALKAKLASLEAGQDTGENGDDGTPVTHEGVYWKERWKAAREMVAALEAPPVVPAGWEVSSWKWAGDSWEEGVGKWRLRATGSTVLEQDGVDVCAIRYASGIPAAAVVALLWAIEHDQRPPHADDEKGGGDG